MRHIATTKVLRIDRGDLVASNSSHMKAFDLLVFFLDEYEVDNFKFEKNNFFEKKFFFLFLFFVFPTSSEVGMGTIKE